MTTDTPHGFRGPDLLQAQSSQLMIVDVQEKLLPAIATADRMIAGCRFLMQGAGLFQVPITVTEQYPQGLKSTIQQLGELVSERVVKDEFGAWNALKWPTAAEDPSGRFQIVMAGIETHVCVLQTAFELQSAGYRVFVVADAVASRRESDKQIALDRMSVSGMTIVTSESVLFEWCERSDRPEFKELSKMVKTRAL